MGLLHQETWEPDAIRDQYDHHTFDGAIANTPDRRYSPEAGRYHRYTSRACPWAHRTTLVRWLLGLEDAISVDVFDPVRRDLGWQFTPQKDGCTPESVSGFENRSEVFRWSEPTDTGRLTVPVLVETATKTVVSEESVDIVRMLATDFERSQTSDRGLFPVEFRDKIDNAIDDSRGSLNTGVYHAGFADSQRASETAVAAVSDAMERWDKTLATQRYVVGDRLTLAVVFLFPTLYRFDAVYHTQFNRNRTRLGDFDHRWEHARDVYQTVGVANTCNRSHVNSRCYRSHTDSNPTGVVPVGPDRNRTGAHIPGELSTTRRHGATV